VETAAAAVVCPTLPAMVTVFSWRVNNRGD
jgi:hypothetical protein